ncbi:amidohydrolase [Anaerosphaera aminiphila DSM 21120]|uniref:Amidohydrolase n=1 Tax=Anaerosphaera aminiphila DSM 21120 TaxID=1120995 RepID=A0A1M5PHG8_9FIRM|nr:amidohydrolase [Anaerosphaera aminiphila]SHH00683.1 amidohydrolase [Anaerosphaera aminiphila DSM 21120]
MEIKNLVEKNRNYIRDMRRYFHAHPELSFEEFETTKKIAEELDKLGIPYEINEKLGTGLVGVIKGAKPGKTVALRADIDALNVTECTDLDFKSQNDGKMHACGHDAHIATLLGAAKMLMEVKDDIQGKIYLVFQPAEEVGLGAKAMIDFGTWYEETDNIFGAHVWSPLEAGKISVEAGERMAAADQFIITVEGKSGHGSAPHETIDAVVVASAIVMNLQSLVSRNYSPLDSVAVTVGSIHSGNRFNIIAGKAVMEGTNRYFSKDIAARIKDDMLRVCENTAAAYGATATLEYNYILGPTTNDPESSAIAEEAVRKVAGPEALIKVEKVTGGEDFSFYLENKPGCFAFIGGGNPDIDADFPHHNEHFNIDDSVLAEGSGVYAQYAIDFLKENA